MSYSLDFISQILTGNHLTEPSETQIANLLTDSRSLLEPETTLFFALRSSRNDGHRYMPELYRRGVRAFVVEQDYSAPEEMPQAVMIRVASPLDALHELVAYHRRRFRLPVIAVTGSRGKTIVKEWLSEAIGSSNTEHVVRSPRSYNSQIGVPLSVWQLADDTTCAIFEAGISQPEEMERLERLILPNIVVITTIDSEHDDGFTSRREKIQQKLLLARRARTLIFDHSDTMLLEEVNRAIARGNMNSGIHLVDSSRFVPLTPPNPHLPRPWQRSNMALCYALLTSMGVPDETVWNQLMQLRPLSTRLNVNEGINRCQLIVDEFPADLLNLMPALDFAANRMHGDMKLTLMITDPVSGSDADLACEQLAAQCRLRGVDRVIGIGEKLVEHADEFPSGSRMFKTVKEAVKALSTGDFYNEMILVATDGQHTLQPLTRMLESRTHETVLEVNLTAMVDNLNFYRSHLKPTTGVVAMVKASGYGAGSLELARTLQSRGASYLAVAVLDEGIDLRRAGITMPIMVLNPKVLNYPLLFSNRLEPEIYGFDILEEIIAEARRLGVKDFPVHIKLDTGMHRLGFLEADLPRLIELVKSQEEIRISSVFSHLATADCFDMDDYTYMQLTTFDRWSQTIVDAMPYKVKRHILNTAGIIRFPEYQYDMVRLGIGLYGVPVLNDGSDAALRPVSTLRTVIIALKRWESGATIGYGRRGRLERDSVIATIPIGYADGINRHMGRGNVEFIVNGVKCKTVGNICMDICMIDVTDVPGVKVGDAVEIFGNANLVGYLAERLDTIPYELLTSVSPRVKRIYFSE